MRFDAERGARLCCGMCFVSASSVKRVICCRRCCYHECPSSSPCRLSLSLSHVFLLTLVFCVFLFLMHSSSLPFYLLFSLLALPSPFSATADTSLCIVALYTFALPPLQRSEVRCVCTCARGHRQVAPASGERSGKAVSLLTRG